MGNEVRFCFKNVILQRDFGLGMTKADQSLRDVSGKWRDGFRVSFFKGTSNLIIVLLELHIKAC